MKVLESKPYSSITLLLIVVSILLIAIHAWRYMPFISDDALISLRYSKRLIQGQGLTWNPGERVEGYSNLLWVLAAAGLGLTRIDLVNAVRVLGFLGMSATVAAVFYARAPQNLRTLLLIFLVALFLPLAGPFAVWTIGGMEQPMVAGLLAWAVVICYRELERPDRSPSSMLVPGLLFALLCLTRLDGALFTVATAGAILIIGGVKRQTGHRIAYLAALPIFFTLAQVGFRLVYYREWIPNTALVKLTPSEKHAWDGWNYVLAGTVPILPLLAITVFSIVISFWYRYQRERMILLCTLAVSWITYVVLIGGDILPAWRHFVPLLLLFILIATEGAEWVGARVRSKSFAGALLVGAVLLSAFFRLQVRDNENYRAVQEQWVWDGQAIGTLMKGAFETQQPLMAVDPAGCLPFWSELPSLDMLGLNDYYLPRHPPADLGKGPIGHELGDGQYVLSRQPDLVVFRLPTGSEDACFPGGKQMQADPRFFREYSLTRFEANKPRKVVSQIWVRRRSERIGIKHLDDRIIVPAFLLNSNTATVARLDQAGKLIVTVSADTPARIGKLELPPGRWYIEAEGSRPSLRVRVSHSSDVGQAPAAGSSETGSALLDAQVPAVLDWNAMPGSTIDVEVAITSEGAVELSQLVFTRLQKR